MAVRAKGRVAIDLISSWDGEQIVSPEAAILLGVASRLIGLARTQFLNKFVASGLGALAPYEKIRPCSISKLSLLTRYFAPPQIACPIPLAVF